MFAASIQLMCRNRGFRFRECNLDLASEHRVAFWAYVHWRRENPCNLLYLDMGARVLTLLVSGLWLEFWWSPSPGNDICQIA